MARVGGRSTPVAAVAGLMIAGVLAVLWMLASPLLPHSLTWAAETLERSGVLLVEMTRDALVALTPEQ